MGQQSTSSGPINPSHFFHALVILKLLILHFLNKPSDGINTLKPPHAAGQLPSFALLSDQQVYHKQIVPDKQLLLLLSNREKLPLHKFKKK